MLPFPNPLHLMERSVSGQLELNPHPPEPDHPTSFFPFSTTDSNSDCPQDLLSSHLILPFAASMANNPQPPLPDPSLNINSMATIAPPTKSRRVVRKDRHSKIFTATGPRDRRMRLSLEVARKFFDLQDMLGFDKASKTVQWLLTMSKAAIKDLAAASRSRARAFRNIESPNSDTSASECEDVSTVSDHKGKSSQMAATSGEAKSRRAKRGNVRPSRKAAFSPRTARETRVKARARARERTREKKRMSSVMMKVGGRENQWASSSLPFDTIEEESGCHDLKSSLDLVAEVEERCSPMPNQCDDYVDKQVLEFPLATESVPFSILEYVPSIVDINDTVGIFQEQWDMEKVLLQGDVQFHSRPWEAFNNSHIA